MAVQQTGTRKKKLTAKQRKEREKRRRMRRLKRSLKYVIPLLVLMIAVGVVMSLMPTRSDKTMVHAAQTAEPMALTEQQAMTENAAQQTENYEATQAPVTDVETQQAEITEAPTAVPTEEPTAAPTDTPAPTEEPTPEPTVTPEPTKFDYDEAYIAALKGEVTGDPIEPNYDNVDASKRSRWPAVAEGYMPIFKNAENVDEKVICVTVDDCYQGDNLARIVDCAISNQANLTIFPIGENLTKEAVASAVKKAWENGSEIENHTYVHEGLYHYDDERMTEELWSQNQQLNKVLGVDYQEHFFRPHGGDERDDQRDHQYIKQMGMYGIAIWNVDGSNSSVDSLKKSLNPGNIYLFHTTDNDRNLLLSFIPYAVKQGYRLITMNEMFGLPDNETGDLASAETEKPALQSFRVDTVSLKNPTYMRAVAVIQKQLHELGWLEADPSGYFGPETEAAVKAFQEASGLTADGIAGVQTCRELFYDDAKRAS